MNNAENVSVGKPAIEGAVFNAPAGTTLPTATATALDAAFKAMGYVSEDGVTNSNGLSTEQIRAWGGDVVLSTKEDKFTFTLIEVLSPEVLKVAYGDTNVTGSSLATGVSVAVNDTQQGGSVYVFEMLLGKDTLKRIVVPKGIVSEIGEIEYKDDEPVGYEITITCGADESGNTHYEYLKTASV